MAEEDAYIIERTGEDWSFTLDLSSRPEYVLMTFRGRSTLKRGLVMVEAIRENLHALTNDQGRLYPGIVDLREEGQVAMDSIKVARSLTEELARRVSYSVVILNPRHPNLVLLQLLLNMLERLSPNRLATAASIEEARQKIRAYHSRQ